MPQNQVGSNDRARARRALLLSLLALAPLAACHDAEAPLSPSAVAPANGGAGMTTGKMSGTMTLTRARGLAPGDLPRVSAGMANAAEAPGTSPTDIVWQNVRTGLRVFWHMNGAQWSGSQNDYMVADTAWKVVAAQDFTGDGTTDLLWQRRASGESVIHQMSGREWSGVQTALYQVTSEWTIVGAGDFTGDGRPDIVWQNRRDGKQVIWRMDGVTWRGEQYDLPSVEPRWWITAAADFTGDGKPDLLWQDQSAGRQVIWHMNGTRWDGAQNELTQVQPDWRIVGATDFTGDNKPDILWQNPREGRQVIWHMNGTTWGGVQNELFQVNPEWVIATTRRLFTAATVTKTAGDGQAVRAGTALPVAPTVRVTDEHGNPVRTAVHFTVTSGSVSNPTVLTDGNGVASAGTWTLGSAPGEQRLTATAGGVSAVFTATAIDPCTLSDPLAFESTISTRLDPGDCVLPNGRLADFYTINVPSTANGVSFTAGSVSFGPETYVYDASGKLIADTDPSTRASATSAPVFILAPAGTYRAGASQFEANGARYTFGVYPMSATSVSNCFTAWVVPGGSGTQTLQAEDCALPGGRYADEYRIRLDAGQSITVLQSSGVIDAFLELVRESDGVVVAQNDNTTGSSNARIAFTAPAAGTYRIRASSASAGQTGAYTLTVQ